MNLNTENTRRKFIKRSALGVSGAAFLGTASMAHPVAVNNKKHSNLPREIWVATVSQQNLEAKNSEEMISGVLDIMEEIIPLRPDIICLPEIFPFANIGPRPPLPEMVQEADNIVAIFAEFAKKHNCYIICPVYTLHNGNTFNSTVLINRQGKTVGGYNKMHPTLGEMEKGIHPGPDVQKVFETDFGKIGMQICYDIEWVDGWNSLFELDAEIVFWPAAYAGGKKLNAYAGLFGYYIVSSTRKGPSRIIDISGQDITGTGIWQANWICAPINLEKKVVASWPNFTSFKEIMQKYGQNIRITNYHDEEISIIESLSADIFVKDILIEFNIKSRREVLQEAANRKIKTQ